MPSGVFLWPTMEPDIASFAKPDMDDSKSQEISVNG